MRHARLAAVAAALVLAGCSSAPSPTAPPQPAAYVVFFQGHSTMLSANARRIIAAAATVATHSPDVLVEISGPSTKLAPGYDPRYAQPRINAVVSQLLADGVGQSRIAQGSSLSGDLDVSAAGDQRVELTLIRGAH